MAGACWHIQGVFCDNCDPRGRWNSGPIIPWPDVRPHPVPLPDPTIPRFEPRGDIGPGAQGIQGPKGEDGDRDVWKELYRLQERVRELERLVKENENG